ncbi:Type I restriction modification DNA specificity domain protein [Bacteroidales bacterium Barb6XT]|nr:Type I restriction modification DNA specificity domain protein [Bacteroidales bacterium Barb6XT]
MVPDSWVWCKFTDLYLLISGRDLENSEYNDKGLGIPYIIGASNINNGEFNINRWTISPKVVSVKNDLLITCKGTIGELVINSMDEIHIARQIMAIRAISTIKVQYTKYCIHFFINGIKESAKGIIPGISREDILNLLIPLPPIEEQKRIVKQIETTFQILDSIQNNI